MSKPASLSGSSLIARKRADTPAPVVTGTHAEKPISITLKLDQARYEAFKSMQAQQRKTGQQILIEALDNYLQSRS